ncbi:MAG: ABC transporter substrate-binding protein [Rhodobacteraceae bacterium]|nr:ABC transporter substrate-binding protein [Paracoccaceae bacterium]
MKHTMLGAVAAVVLALGGAAAAAQERVTYLFPAPDFLPAFAPFQIAKHLGYFEEAGLDVEFRVGQGGADVATQVAVGNADLGGGIGDTPIVVRANGLPIRGVALLGGRGLTQIAWRTDRGIESLSDLRGKTIGVLAFQDTTYYNLLGVLASEGLRRADVSAQAVGAGGIIQLMISGDLDAISGVPEWIDAIQQAGVEIDQVPVDSVFPAMAQAILASDRTIAERPEVVQGFVNAVLRAIRDIKEDPAAMAQVYTEAVPRHQGTEETIERIMRAYVENVYAEAAEHPLGTFDPARLAEVQAFYLDREIVRVAVPVDELFTNQFVE